jgi:hypothetical protein
MITRNTCWAWIPCDVYLVHATLLIIHLSPYARQKAAEVSQDAPCVCHEWLKWHLRLRLPLMHEDLENSSWIAEIDQLGMADHVPVRRSVFYTKGPETESA